LACPFGPGQASLLPGGCIIQHTAPLTEPYKPVPPTPPFAAMSDDVHEKAMSDDAPHEKAMSDDPNDKTKTKKNKNRGLSPATKPGDVALR